MTLTSRKVPYEYFDHSNGVEVREFWSYGVN